ncbi:MAG: glycine zipper family protein [SAR86 cluster bacterium]|uniref:Glycine zipper family protein n=1 Tax=SAR86 cluster bacterium TaxID=2030880 RepID=A0A2A4WYP7_9GAMM|nr:MAG: glycine zipper family protein [SAR86 cluster bacterium]
MCVSALAACASVEDLTGNNPIIDTQGVNPARYDANLVQCEAYADEVAIAQKAGAGVISGAVVGGVFGAIVGNSGTAKKGAGIGAIGGGARGVGEGIRERERVIKRCLIGRGYRVLN